MPYLPLLGKFVWNITVSNKVTQIIYPVRSNWVNISYIQFVGTIWPKRCDKLITKLINTDGLNQIIKVQIDWQGVQLLIRVISIYRALVRVEHKDTTEFLWSRLIDKRKEIIIILVKCAITLGKRRGNIPNAPTACDFKNASHNGVWVGLVRLVVELECTLFQKEFL